MSKALELAPGLQYPSGPEFENVLRQTARQVLVGSPSWTAELADACAQLVQREDVDAVALTWTAGPLAPVQEWVLVGNKAWVRQWLGPGAPCTMTRRGADSQVEPLLLPWLSTQVRATGLVAVPDVTLLPPEAGTDTDQLGECGIGAYLGAPFVVAYEDVSYGSIGVARARPGQWADDLVVGLRLVAAAVAAQAANGYYRQMAAEAVERADAAVARQHRLLGAAAHELRGPIAAVVMATELLQDDLQDAGHPNWASATGDVLKTARHLSGVLTNVLTTARNAPALPVTEGTSVTAALEDVSFWLEHVVRTAGYTVTCDVAEDVEVAITATALRQTLSNLVGNAIRYGGTAAHVSAVRTCDERGLGRVRVSVADNGPGLTCEQAGTVFDAYVRFAPDDIAGTGLGLAVARTAVESYAGGIGVERGPDGGASFWFELPTFTPCDPPVGPVPPELTVGSLPVPGTGQIAGPGMLRLPAPAPS